MLSDITSGTSSDDGSHGTSALLIPLALTLMIPADVAGAFTAGFSADSIGADSDTAGSSADSIIVDTVDPIGAIIVGSSADSAGADTAGSSAD